MFFFNTQVLISRLLTTGHHQPPPPFLPNDCSSHPVSSERRDQHSLFQHCCHVVTGSVGILHTFSSAYLVWVVGGHEESEAPLPSLSVIRAAGTGPSCYQSRGSRAGLRACRSHAKLSRVCSAPLTSRSAPLTSTKPSFSRVVHTRHTHFLSSAGIGLRQHSPSANCQRRFLSNQFIDSNVISIKF